jgi:hypothetical protein
VILKPTQFVKNSFSNISTLQISSILLVGNGFTLGAT